MNTAERRGEGLRGYLNRGGLWRWVCVVVAYLLVYLGAGWVASKLGGRYVHDDLLSSAGSVFFQVILALAVGAVVLGGFITYMGWTKEIFGRQPIYRSWWMWLGPLIALTPVVLRVLGIDWGRNSIDVIAMVLLAGVLVGFVEELMYRGIGVKMLRDGGHGEWAVAVLSSIVFAFSHSVNLFTGQAIMTVAFTWVYTFAFGILMYLTLRTTMFLIGPMVVHALTDPTTILATGGIDELKNTDSSNGLLTAAGNFTFLLIVLGFVLAAFIRGRATRSVGSGSTA